MDKFLLYHNVPFIVYFLLFYVSFIVHLMYRLDYCINLHEYSSAQTPLNIIHKYTFLDNQNPSGGEHFILI